MENLQARSEQTALPINYYWNPTDPALPFSSAAPGNAFLFPPSNATRTAVPTEFPKGTHPCWDSENSRWVILPDYRQVRLWDKVSGQEIFSSTINCPSTAIDIEPPSRNAVWDEDASTWVIDQVREDAEAANERLKRKTTEIAVASDQIEQIEEIVDYLDDEEELVIYTGLLKEWKQYRAKLNLLKPADPNAKFPVRPKLLGE